MPTTINTSVVNFFKSAVKKTKITEDRKELLLKISKTVATELSSGAEVNLNFICTHNSRRSQIAQVWGFFFADYFDLNIQSFSGGTEVTAFYRNSVKTLQSAGFLFQLQDFSHQNPKYSISFGDKKKTITGFSKRYDHVENKEPLIAITTCDSADAKCPFIPSALHRFHLPFTDPKFSDGTVNAENEYLKTNMQIASEIHFILSEVKVILA
ncbi:hypothetical protein N9V96_02425 [Polaribacter sp.]|nr:hypothetical protein [Polaribacter sp.]